MNQRLNYFLLLISAGLFYVFYNGYLSYLLFIFVLILPLISLFITLIAYFINHVSVSLDKEIISYHDTAALQILRQKNALIPVSRIRFDKQINQFLSNEHNVERLSFDTTQWINKIEGKHCGKMDIIIYNFYDYDYLGLIKIKKHQRNTLSLLILPIKKDIKKYIEHLELFNQSNTVYDPYHSGDDYSELFDMREYRDGDPINRIHWKLSTKQQKLIIKEGSSPIDKRIMVTFQLTYDTNENDEILSTFHSFCLYLCQLSYPFDIAYKILKHREIMICHIENENQYMQALQEMLSLNLEKNFPIQNADILKQYTYLYLTATHQIIEKTMYLGDGSI